MPQRNVVILGSTGSIGCQTIEVVAACSNRLRVIGLSAHRSFDALLAQARKIRPRWATLTDPTLQGHIDVTGLNGSTELLWGDAGVERMVTEPETDIVVSAMVGAAGLRGTVAAIQAGKCVALANKESLVVAGPLVTGLARRHNCELLPVDSEHSAIFQCLKSGNTSEIARIILTASGGPFRNKPIQELGRVTVDEALRHPTWKMGPKITIDSATMMNKALEVIEARWLFGVPVEAIEVVVHPQSIVHSLVEFVDGSLIAQASPPDMRLPIQYALTYPDRVVGPARRWDTCAPTRWDFEPVDLDRYPAVRLGFQAARHGGTCGAAINAANEIAVARFLDGRLRFSDIVALTERILNSHPFDASPSFDDLWRVDEWARMEADRWKP